MTQFQNHNKLPLFMYKTFISLVMVLHNSQLRSPLRLRSFVARRPAVCGRLPVIVLLKSSHIPWFL